MPQFTVDPVTGHLLMDGVPLTNENAYGTSGQMLSNDLRIQPGQAAPSSEYYNQLGGFLDESGNMIGRADIRPDVQERMRATGGGQIGQFGVGGYDEVIDPSRLTWNDEFGVMNPEGNQGPRDRATRRHGLTALALVAGGALASGALGAGAGVGATDAATGYGLGGSAGEAAATGGMGGMGAAGAGAGTIGDAGMLNAADFTAPAADGTLGSWAGTGLEGGGGLGTQAMEWVQAHPMQAARLGLTGYNLLSGGGSGVSGSTGNIPLMGGLGNPQSSGFRKESIKDALSTASGYAPQDPLEKVKQAMMDKRKPVETNPWDYKA